MFNLQEYLQKTEKEFDKEYANIFISVGYAEECKLFLRSAIKNAVKEIITEMENLIVSEILICHEENQPTSRLTSLFNKIKTIIK